LLLLLLLLQMLIMMNKVDLWLLVLLLDVWLADDERWRRSPVRVVTNM
jgi:hypothetical protein